MPRAAGVSQAAYVPLDELLERPRVRILRAMQRFDWVTSTDLGALLQVPAEEWNNHSVHLGRLFRSGCIDRRGSAAPFDYRITDKGRRELRAILDRSQL